MTEEFFIRLAPPKELTVKRDACRRGHVFEPGSYYRKLVCVKGKHYEVRDCKQCNLLRQSQYRKRQQKKK